MAWVDRDVDVRNVEGWGSEPGGVVDSGSTGGVGAIAFGGTVLLGDDEKPRNGKGGSICGVDERIADVERR